MWASDSPYQIQYQIQCINNYKAPISLIRDRLDVSKNDGDWLLRKTAETVFFFV